MALDFISKIAIWANRQGAPELYPSALSDEIEALNSDLYDNISNGTCSKLIQVGSGLA